MDPDDDRLENPNLLRGRILGGCRIEDRIGRGGMGSVYRAWDLSLKRPVAVKILAPFLLSEPAIQTRFEREARAGSRVNHPHVVRLFSTAIEDGLHFTVMEFVDGPNLSEVLKRHGRLPFSRAVEIAFAIASGLEALHAGGLVHRDIKPSNVLISSTGAIKITDFGIARDCSEVHSLTATGDLLGTVGFSAPEQFDNAAVDGRADLYSLGATLHYMLTGTRPPSDPRLPFIPLGDDSPGDVRQLLDRLLANSPEGRPADARTVMKALFPHLNHSKTAGSVRVLSRNGARVSATILAGIALFSAGALASEGRLINSGTSFWIPLIPHSKDWVLCAILCVVGIGMAATALIGRGARRGLGVRSTLGIALFMSFILTAYVAGAATGAPTLDDALRTLLNHTPGTLLGCAILCAAMGLLLGAPSQSSRGAKGVGGSLLFAALGLAALASSPGDPELFREYLSKQLSESTYMWTAVVLMLASLIFLFIPRTTIARIPILTSGVSIALLLVFYAGDDGGTSQLWKALSSSSGQLLFAILLALGAWGVLTGGRTAGIEVERLSNADEGAFTSTPS